MTQQPKPEPFISTNALLLFLLPTLGTILVSSGAIGFYDPDKGWILPFGLWSIISGLVYLGLGEKPSVTSNRRRWLWATTSCLVLVLGLTARQIIIRPGNARPSGVYDGAVQSEEAADFLLHGKNPYGADYRGTPYAVLNAIPSSGIGPGNPVWYHYIYPPLTFLIFVPIRILQPLLGPLADYRLISVGALLLLAWLLVRRTKDISTKTTTLLLTLGNPLLWMYAIIGANETLLALAIVGSTLLFERQRWTWSGVLFGAAIASKQVAWLLIPLWLYWLWRQVRSGDITALQARNVLFGTCGTVAVLFLPFFIWGPARLWTDLVVFATGSIANTYPLAGTTFLQYLHVFHVIASPWSPVPVYLFQLLVGVPMFVMTARWVHRNRSISTWLVAATVFMLSLLLVGRYFNNNFLTTPVAFLATAYLLEATSTPTERQAPHDS